MRKREEDAARPSLQRLRGAQHHSAELTELLNEEKMQEVELLIQPVACNRRQLLCGCMSLSRNITLIFLNTTLIILTAWDFLHPCVVIYGELSLDSLSWSYCGISSSGVTRSFAARSPRFAVGFV